MALKGLTPVEERAWRGYRRLVTLLEARMARELAADRGLSPADYTVLSNLAEASGRRWRLSRLAERMQWSQSRLSHQVARMEERGLVRREFVEGDGRGTSVVLTSTGLRTIAAATPGHVAAIRRHFLDLLDEEQLRVLGDAAEAVVGHLTADGVSESPIPRTREASDSPERRRTPGRRSG